MSTAAKKAPKAAEPKAVVTEAKDKAVDTKPKDKTVDSKPKDKAVDSKAAPSGELSSDEESAQKRPRKALEEVTPAALVKMAKTKRTLAEWEAAFKGKALPGVLGTEHLLDFAQKTGDAEFYTACVVHTIKHFKKSDLALGMVCIGKHAM